MGPPNLRDFARMVDETENQAYFNCLAASPGEVTERPKVQHWKCCVLAIVPRVQIPSSPLKRQLGFDPTAFFVESCRFPTVASGKFRDSPVPLPDPKATHPKAPY